MENWGNTVLIVATINQQFLGKVALPAPVLFRSLERGVIIGSLAIPDTIVFIIKYFYQTDTGILQSADTVKHTATDK